MERRRATFLKKLPTYASHDLLSQGHVLDQTTASLKKFPRIDCCSRLIEGERQLDTWRHPDEVGCMNPKARAQIRLILEDADILATKAVDSRLTEVYAAQSGKGRLHSGSTVKLAIAVVEDVARQLVTKCVDRVAAVAKDVEAFAMIQEPIELFLKSASGHLERIAELAVGGWSERTFVGGHLSTAESLFSETRRQLERQL